jgi:hypothetical protein
MATRNLLQRASAIAHEHGRDAAVEGNQDDADRAYAVSDELDKLAKTAELRDELWAAAKAHGDSQLALLAHINEHGDDFDTHADWDRLRILETNTTNRLCTIGRKVAETET